MYYLDKCSSLSGIRNLITLWVSCLDHLVRLLQKINSLSNFWTCCSIMCIVVMSDTISAKHDVRFVFTASCLQEGSHLINVICVCLCVVVSNTYCVVFLFCFSSYCVPCVASFSGLSSYCVPCVASFSGLSSSCVPYVTSFSGLSIYDYPFGVL